MINFGSLGSIIGSIGRLLPRYVEGERDAIKDNWQDLLNYNQAQKGQLENMWTADTYDTRYNMAQHARVMSEANMLRDLMGYNLERVMYPYRYQTAAIGGRYLPMLEASRIGGTFRMTQGWGGQPGVAPQTTQAQQAMYDPLSDPSGMGISQYGFNRQTARTGPSSLSWNMQY